MEIYTKKQPNEISLLSTRAVKNLLVVVANPIQVKLFFLIL